MIYNYYGESKKKVSAVGFGGMRFDLEQKWDQNVELVRYAAQKGINYFDTAPTYCQGNSEKIFAEAFSTMKRNEFFVSTKENPETCENGVGARKALERSLRQLQVDRVDFYHVWCLRRMENYQLAMRPGGQYEELLRCQQEGLIDQIVFSTHQKSAEIIEILKTGNFTGVLLGVNILNFPYRWDAVLEAQKQGCGVVAMNPLAGGLIPQNEGKLAFLAQQETESPTEAALRFCISCPEITVTLNGFQNKDQVDMACRIADEAAPFQAKEIEKVKNNISQKMDQICTGCGYCDYCPQGIPVAAYMQYYNKRSLFGFSEEKMIEQMEFQHRWGNLHHGQNKAAACVACGICEKNCTQHLKITDSLREIACWERQAQKKEMDKEN